MSASFLSLFKYFARKQVHACAVIVIGSRCQNSHGNRYGCRDKCQSYSRRNHCPGSVHFHPHAPECAQDTEACARKSEAWGGKGYLFETAHLDVQDSNEFLAVGAINPLYASS